MNRRKLESRLLPALAAASLIASPAAAETACIPRQNVGDMVIVLMPPIIDAAAQHCAAVTGPALFLKQPAARQLRDRLAAQRDARTPSAAGAFKGMAGQELPAGISDKTIVSLMTESLPAELFKDTDFTLASCTDIDQLFAAMAPMSVDQIAQFAVALLSLSKVRDPSICPP